MGTGFGSGPPATFPPARPSRASSSSIGAAGWAGSWARSASLRLARNSGSLQARTTCSFFMSLSSTARRAYRRGSLQGVSNAADAIAAVAVDSGAAGIGLRDRRGRHRPPQLRVVELDRSGGMGGQLGALRLAQAGAELGISPGADDVLFLHRLSPRPP